MEIFVFPELMYSLVLANIMSPIIWRWRQLDCFEKLRGKSSYKKLMRLTLTLKRGVLQAGRKSSTGLRSIFRPSKLPKVTPCSATTVTNTTSMLTSANTSGLINMTVTSFHTGKPKQSRRWMLFDTKKATQNGQENAFHYRRFMRRRHLSSAGYR